MLGLFILALDSDVGDYAELLAATVVSPVRSAKSSLAMLGLGRQGEDRSTDFARWSCSGVGLKSGGQSSLRAYHHTGGSCEPCLGPYWNMPVLRPGCTKIPGYYGCSHL